MTREARIKKSTEFQSYPPAVQEKIRKGEVEVGFTEEMVRLALGKPDRKYTRTTDRGSEEVWAYIERRSKPGIGVSVGVGAGSPVGYGGGVSVGTSADEVVERLRVSFQSGKVVSIEDLK